MTLPAPDRLNMFGAFRHMLGIQIAASLTALSGIFVDSIVISRYLGTSDMASFGFAQPAVLIVAALAMIFSTGMQSLAGKGLGRGDMDSVNATASLALVLASATGLFFSLIAFFGAVPIVRALGASGDTLIPAAEYLRGVAPGLFFIILGPLMTGLMQIDGDPARSFISVAAMTGVNIVLDFANVFLFHGGLLGMALATAFSNLVNIGIMVLHFMKKDGILRLSFRHVHFRKSGVLLRTGLPTANQQLCIVVRTTIINRLLSGLAGSAAVAAFTTLCSVVPLVLSVMNGIANTALLVTGVVIGEEDRVSLEKLISSIGRMTLWIALGVFTALFALSGGIARVFVGAGDPAQLALVTRTFRLFSLATPFLALDVFCIGQYQSMGRILLANGICLCENVLLVTPIAFVLSRFMGTDGVWLSFLVTEVLLLLWQTLHASRRLGKLPRHPAQFFLPRDGFGLPAERRVNFSATSVEDAAALSEQIISFLRERGVDDKRSLYTGICMEEMAVLALQNSASTGKRCQVDVFLAIRDDGAVTVRLKDNGVRYDPAAQHELLNPDDLVEHIAVRMFFRMVREADYRYVFDLNTLTYTI